jgi:hypothetical protein
VREFHHAIRALAVRQYGHLRFTEDIDILTTKEGLEKIHSRFGGRGINPRAAGLRKKLYESEHQVNGLAEGFAAGLHTALREKYIEILEMSRKEKDIE